MTTSQKETSKSIKLRRKAVNRLDHKLLTEARVPRRINGNKLGLRKRKLIEAKIGHML